ncbi:MAG: VWA domain-containing protein, partial [Chloroflexi bacterium]|nr:VWA domain-containing protein [Chloroflexota bacterium]
MIRNITHRGPGWRRAFALAATGVIIGSVLLVGSTVLIASAAAPITSGNLSPTANHAPNQWTNPGNAWDGDGTNYATAIQNNDQGYSSFNLPAIPDGSIITGIRVTAVAKTVDPDCDLGVSLSWNNGSSTTSRQDRSIGTGDTTVTFGGVPGASGNDANTFGRVWSPSELTNATFVAIVRSVDTGTSCPSNTVTSLKSIQVAVAYRPGEAGTANPAIVPGAICGQADFDFVVDTSGSIGSANMATVRSQLQAFSNAYQTGGDGRYSLTSFSSSAIPQTAGFVNAATFDAAAAALPASGGRTWTAAGISTGAGNNANDRAGVPNIMFVLTDGSPNMNSASQPTLDDPKTWQDGADAAIGAANAARGSYVVNAVFVGTGDTSLPFTSAYDAAYTSFVMTQIGGGSYSSIADFGNIATGLLDLLGCRNIVVTKVTDLHPTDTQFSGSISNAQDGNVPAAWSLTSIASGSTTLTSTTVSVGRNHAHVVTEDPVPSGWTLVGWYGPISTTALCPTDPGQYSGTSVSIPSGTANQQVCVFDHFASVPALTLDKTTSTPSYSAVGQSISYGYLLTNSGNVSL